MALYTKTWTVLHWISFVVFSILIYIIFLLVGNNLTSFKSYRTPGKVLKVWGYYLTVLFFCIVIYVYDMSIMIITKEFITPLSTLFNSIVRREKETDESLFRNITNKFHTNAKVSGPVQESKSIELAKPLADQNVG